MSNTNELTVDVRGSLCPKPVIETNVEPAPEIGCKPMNYSDRIILMTKDYLGEGSEELGRNLMKTFWVCMVEADVKPSKIYFINSSVKMVTKDSVHLENIKKLADAGVEIAACGICLDFYGEKENVGVGSITNMYAITDAILSDNIVKL